MGYLSLGHRKTECPHPDDICSRLPLSDWIVSNLPRRVGPERHDIGHLKS